MSHTNSVLGRVLVLTPDPTDMPELIEQLHQLGEIQVESTKEAVLRALGEKDFDLVLAVPDVFLPCRQPGNCVQLQAVLDTINQGACIIDLDAHILWSNATLDEFPAAVSERIEKHCIDSLNSAEGKHGFNRPRSLSLVIDDDRYFEVSISPIVRSSQEETRLVAVVSDVSRARHLQRKLDAIDKAGRELVRLDADDLSKMDARQRLELLECKIIRCIRDLLHFDNFVIRLLDKSSNKLELVLCAGLPLEAQQIDIYASTENSGISGYVAATGRSYICPDVRTDPRYLRGINGARSSLSVPLHLHDQIIGILNIESEGVGGFSEDDRQFAEIFGRYIAIALHILNLLVSERYTTTGRLANNVSAEIAGPLADILADASTLIEDYIGHDDLRHRLQGIADNVVRIRESVKQVTRPEGGILGSKPQKPKIDPLFEDKAILVIDDEEIIRRTVSDVLSQKGCKVESAREGNEALALISQRKYDLVISDIRLPGRSGYEIFQAVKNANPDCPVIFMTGFGYDPNHSIIRANVHGLAAVLYKPFKVDQLVGDIRDALSEVSDSTK